jgi:Ser/Thr protein kinase RdoA (MazF antagonist)
VGRLGDDVVLRAYAPGQLPDLPPLPGTSPVLAEHARLAVRAVRWVPGSPLDALVRTGLPVPALRAAGAALARLHERPAGGLPAQDDGLSAAAAQLAVLLPDLAEDASALAARLRPPSGGVTLHGDFSADQVVVDGDRAVLVDLDRVRAGSPADDLGCWRAAALCAGVPADAERALHEGYADVRPLPEGDDVP